jgi:hypothetical protein
MLGEQSCDFRGVSELWFTTLEAQSRRKALMNKGTGHIDIDFDHTCEHGRYSSTLCAEDGG